MGLDEAIKSLENSKNVKFIELFRVCETFFGKARIRGSHHIFKMPWAGRLNIQKDKKMAKQYQVRQVAEALKKLKSMEDE